MTSVIFRIEDDGEILAVFPFVPSSCSVVVYSHNGQHSSADGTYIRDCTKPAAASDYASLLSELRSMGYKDLSILDRYPTHGEISRRRASNPENL